MDFKKKLIDKLVHLFEFLFPKKRKEIESNLEEVFQNRWKIVTNTLGISMEIPKYHVEFNPDKHAYYSRNEKQITLTSQYVNETKEMLNETIDHEITHHIQYRTNPHLLPKKFSFDDLIPDDIYWLVKGKLKDTLLMKAFKEGFATFIAYRTSGILNPFIAKAIPTLKKGQRWKLFLSKVLPYALGYLTFQAISETCSEKSSIEIGLYKSPAVWVSTGREAFFKLEKPFYI